jgi:hypothetical protein
MLEYAPVFPNAAVLVVASTAVHSQADHLSQDRRRERFVE